MNKVAIIGSGFVGSTTAYTLALSGTANEIVIVDINREKAEGDALDISHAVPLIQPVDVYAGDYSDVKDSDIIIISAGANSKPGETRLDLTGRNTGIFKSIIPNVVKGNDSAIYLVVTNPVDILTYVTRKISGLPSKKVIGSGTVLDSSRFRYLLSRHCSVDARNVHGYIIGEHGDSELAAWSITNIAGTPIDNYCSICGRNCESRFKEETAREVKESAYKIIQRKGATYYGVAAAVRRIVECILRDEKSILTVSSTLEGQYGISGVSLSLPSIVGSDGVEKVLELPISDDEVNKLRHSAAIMSDVISRLDI